ncbi:MAG: carbohydrate kinase, partial [Clostridia bacterium]
TEPNILTGGGDNFNAGFSFGILLGLEMFPSLLLGNVVAGYYVTYGRSPDRSQLVRWLEKYHATGGRL